MISTAIILDNLGTFTESPDQERDKILEELKKIGLDIDLKLYDHLFTQIKPEDSYDLVICDFGALWQTDMSHESRYIMEWVEAHPSSLVMLWSSLTAEIIIADELSPFNDKSGWYDSLDFPYNLRPYYPPSYTRNRVKSGWLKEGWVYGDKFLREWFSGI